MRGLKVTADELPDYVEKITRRYLEERTDGERFATWSLREPSEEALITVSASPASARTRAPACSFATGDPAVPAPRTDRRLPEGRWAGASAETLETVARQANRDLEGKSAQEVIAWAVEAFGNRFCVTSSMQDMVLAHIASTVAPGVDVVFLDTGYHFAETIGTRDAVDATMDVRLITVRPTQTVAEQDATLGPSSTTAIPSCAASCARSHRCAGRWRTTTPTRPASVESSRRYEP